MNRKISNEEKIKSLEEYATKAGKIIYSLHSTMNELVTGLKKGKDFKECPHCKHMSIIKNKESRREDGNKKNINN